MSSLSICKCHLSCFCSNWFLNSIWLLHDRHIQSVRTNARSLEPWRLPDMGWLTSVCLHFASIYLECNARLQVISSHLWSTTTLSGLLSLHDVFSFQVQRNVCHMDLFGPFLWRWSFHDCSEHSKEDLRWISHIAIRYPTDIHRVFIFGDYRSDGDASWKKIFFVFFLRCTLFSFGIHYIAVLLWREEISIWRNITTKSYQIKKQTEKRYGKGKKSNKPWKRTLIYRVIEFCF